MKKKIYLMMFALIAMFVFTDVAFADSTSQVVREGDALYTTFASEYENYPSITIKEDAQEVLVYGYSKCTTTDGCTYSYQGTKNDDIEELLIDSISCENESKSINYGLKVSNANDFKRTSYKSENVEVYWSEVYTVTCTSDGAVQIEDSSDVGETPDDSSTGTGTKDDYSSSSSVDSVDTGVETYYIVLIIIAIISYVIMRIVKKYNLFKNV